MTDPRVNRSGEFPWLEGGREREAVGTEEIVDWMKGLLAVENEGLDVSGRVMELATLARKARWIGLRENNFQELGDSLPALRRTARQKTVLFITRGRPVVAVTKVISDKDHTGIGVGL